MSKACGLECSSTWMVRVLDLVRVLAIQTLGYSYYYLGGSVRPHLRKALNSAMVGPLRNKLKRLSSPNSPAVGWNECPSVRVIHTLILQANNLKYVY